ncbi:hypothetical protein RJ641_009938, partial [Dillenia turbinata]
YTLSHHATLLLYHPLVLYFVISVSSLSFSLRKKMARLLILALFVLLPALASARHISRPFVVQGGVYCDTCRCGFETPASTKIAGAQVRIECKNRDTLELKYQVDGKTDSSGKFSILVEDDHGEEICEAMLVSSPVPDCAKVDPGREKSRVILTRFNGMESDTRYSNNLGFLRDEPLASCTQVLKQYQEYEE